MYEDFYENDAAQIDEDMEFARDPYQKIFVYVPLDTAIAKKSIFESFARNRTRIRSSRLSALVDLFPFFILVEFR